MARKGPDDPSTVPRLPIGVVGLLTIATVAGLLVLWIVGSGGWPGAESGCVAAGDCGCEAIGPGLIAQPGNALSSIALVIGGMGIAAIGSLRRTGWADRLLSPDRALGLGAVVILAGVASAAYHASLREWAGWADLTGTGSVLVFAIAHRALGKAAPRTFATTLLIGVGAVAMVMALVGTAAGKFVLLLLASGAVLLEAAALRRQRTATPGWLVTAAVAYALGTGAWWLGRGNGRWCDPAANWQWHSWWHVLVAAALVALALYWHSERSTDAAP